MKVLQFALGAPDTSSDPRTHAVQHHDPRQVVYPGTHDNDTAEGWFSALAPEQKEWTLDAIGRGPEWVSWKLTRMAYLSVAELAVVPMQDLLGLGSPSRMNTPGDPDGNWAWRFRPDQVPAGLATALTRLAQLSGRSRD
jgi:4-alpha-glucanotransferase